MVADPHRGLLWHGADPKPRRRVKDPALLRRIHAAYQRSGCGYCGVRGTWSLPIEVHHIQKRSQGGDDSWENCIGLCGERGGCRAHFFVEQNQYVITRADGTLWLTTPLGIMQRLIQLDG